MNPRRRPAWWTPRPALAGGGALAPAPPAPLAPAARRLLKHPRLMPYHRLVVAVLALNAAVLGSTYAASGAIDDGSTLPRSPRSPW